ncbi:MAG: response regulator [Xanthomonadaceae bacterium]|nr:response regulator [Xanthomonadaceae bacterium]
MAQKKLLVADDSLTIQKVIRLALGNEGYEIQTVSDGAQALEQIATFRPDIVLIDVSLAKKTAFEVKKEINGHRDLAHIKFVLMSSAFKQVDEAQATSAGFDGRLIKPFDPAHLRSIITQALGSASQTPSSLAPTQTAAPSKRNEVDFGSFLSHINNPPPGEFGADPKPLTRDVNEKSDPEIPTTAPRSVAPPEGMSDDLWKTDAGFQSGSVEDDIRKLTESTLKMSGFADDSGWSVQEKKAPSSFQNNDWQASGASTNDLGFQFTMPETEGSKADPTMEPHHQLFDFESSWTSEPSERQTAQQSGAKLQDKPTHMQRSADTYRPESTPTHEEATSSQHQAETQSAMQSFNLDHEHLEKLIQEQVAVTLEKVLRTMLPDLAERVIKAEIHKMLENPPNQL